MSYLWALNGPSRRPFTMRNLIIAIALLAAPATRAQTLVGHDHWPDGTLRYTAYAQGGRTHFVRYHENGRVQETGAYHQGKPDGLWKQYTDTGALVTRATFRDGVRQGVWEFRTVADEPLGLLHYRDGALARGTLYGADGELVAQRDY